MIFTYLAARLGPIEPPSDSWGGEIQDAAEKASSDAAGAAAASTLELIISRAIGLMTIVAGIYFLVNFVIAGIGWLSAGGNSSNVEKARNSIINSLVGMIVVVGAYAIVGLIGSLMGLDILSSGSLLLNLAP